MNAWAAFALGIFVGATLGSFFLGMMVLGARADRDLEIAIAKGERALKELDDKKAQNE